MTDNKTQNVLFICTGNSARSIMAEALITTMSSGRYVGFSAGSFPNGAVNPFAIEQIKKINYPIERLRSKNWDEFILMGAPKMDFIITVCDNAAGETCPFWPGQPITAHWGFADPAAVKGSDENKRCAFAKIFQQIQLRIAAFINLPSHALDRKTMQYEVIKIAQDFI